MNAEEIKQLHTTVQDLIKKIDRHEWRIVDVEKRLNHTHKTDDMQQMPLADEQEYKEPILKKADKRLDRPKKVIATSYNKRNKKVLVIGLFAALIICTYFLYHAL